MEIIKRNGQKEKLQEEKIRRVILAAFHSLNHDCQESILEEMIQTIVKQFEGHEQIHVEEVSDQVEVTLMKYGFYQEAKCFILYRDQRNQERIYFNLILDSLSIKGLDYVLKKIQRKFSLHQYSLEFLYKKYQTFIKEGMDDQEKLKNLIKASVECIQADAPDWEYIASYLLSFQLELNIQSVMTQLNLHSFYDKVVYLCQENLMGHYLKESYNKNEIDELEAYCKPQRNDLFTYSGLDLLIRRYLICDHEHHPLESVQEMFMGIAMHLCMNETKDRLQKVKDLYDILSQLQVTMATPTMANARKPFAQLSSCFIDTVEDSLDGIYASLSNFARVSKFGGGMGLYFGKVRASGSDIRGFKNVAGGVIRWLKLANDTAVAVDQLGVRQGSVACYLDVWHKDILDFLQLKTNNGDDRKKAHDIFPAVCFPDLFWKKVKESLDQPWYLLDPHEVLVVKGYALEDSYGEEWEQKYEDCLNDVRIHKEAILLKDLVRLMIKSAAETGTPFIFNRDHVNKMNPNKHQGMIYSSNLCTEIAQNMKASSSLSQEIMEIDGEVVIVEKTIPGDYVVCNLASLVLGNIDVKNEGELKHIVQTIVRALDNVIDLNFYPVAAARLTNQKYRSIGLGVSGYHHLLAKEGIAWESEEHLTFVDDLFEKINYAAIEASSLLAKEKGSYAYFEGSDWQNGQYFKLRNYKSPQWLQLSQQVQETGLRNGYLLAIAPTSSTSIIAGSTAGIDPIMNRFFLEEKKGSLLARVAPLLSPKTWWFYKSAHTIDQHISIQAAGIRQRHIDQAQSLNLYITNDYTFRQILNLYLEAWENQVKTIYYVRSKSLEVEECESCAS